MQIRSVYIVGSVVAALLVITVAFTSVSAQGTDGSATPVSVMTPESERPPAATNNDPPVEWPIVPASREVHGYPAITVHAADNQGVAMITPEDVGEYVKTHKQMTWDPEAEPPAIVQIEFQSPKALHESHGADFGLPGDALLCFVRLKGSFVVSSPMGGSWTSSSGYLIFNARTGNLLSEGVDR